MSDLLDKLHEMRATTVKTMADGLAKDEGWAGWLALLAQVEAAIRAIEAVEEEGEDCARGVPQAARSARGA